MSHRVQIQQFGTLIIRTILYKCIFFMGTVLLFFGCKDDDKEFNTPKVVRQPHNMEGIIHKKNSAVDTKLTSKHDELSTKFMNYVPEQSRILYVVFDDSGSMKGFFKTKDIRNHWERMIGILFKAYTKEQNVRICLLGKHIYPLYLKLKLERKKNNQKEHRKSFQKNRKNKLQIVCVDKNNLANTIPQMYRQYTDGTKLYRIRSLFQINQFPSYLSTKQTDVIVVTDGVPWEPRVLESDISANKFQGMIEDKDHPEVRSSALGVLLMPFHGIYDFPKSQSLQSSSILREFHEDGFLRQILMNYNSEKNELQLSQKDKKYVHNMMRTYKKKRGIVESLLYKGPAVLHLYSFSTHPQGATQLLLQLQQTLKNERTFCEGKRFTIFPLRPHRITQPQVRLLYAYNIRHRENIYSSSIHDKIRPHGWSVIKDKQPKIAVEKGATIHLWVAAVLLSPDTSSGQELISKTKYDPALLIERKWNTSAFFKSPLPIVLNLRSMRRRIDGLEKSFSTPISWHRVKYHFEKCLPNQRMPRNISCIKPPPINGLSSQNLFLFSTRISTLEFPSVAQWEIKIASSELHVTPQDTDYSPWEWPSSRCPEETQGFAYILQKGARRIQRKQDEPHPFRVWGLDSSQGIQPQSFRIPLSSRSNKIFLSLY